MSATFWRQRGCRTGGTTASFTSHIHDRASRTHTLIRYFNNPADPQKCLLAPRRELKARRVKNTRGSLIFATHISCSCMEPLLCIMYIYISLSSASPHSSVTQKELSTSRFLIHPPLEPSHSDDYTLLRVKNIFQNLDRPPRGQLAVANSLYALRQLQVDSVLYCWRILNVFELEESHTQSGLSLRPEEHGEPLN